MKLDTKTFRYCPFCGKKLRFAEEDGMFDGAGSSFCTTCGLIHRVKILLESSMGCCVFCGASNPTVHVRFKDTFTAYQYVQAGDWACRRCSVMLEDAKFRRNCWVMFGNEEKGWTKWHKIEDVLSFLKELPQPPFVIYLTLQKRKHGWILAVQNPVLNRNRFILVVDEEKIFFERTRFLELTAFSQTLFSHGVPKAVLLGGYPSASAIRRFKLSFDECSRLRSLQRDRLWYLVIKFGKRIEQPKKTL